MGPLSSSSFGPAILACIALAPACGREAAGVGSARVSDVPPGAVLCIDGHEYITRAEVEEWVECVASIETSASPPQLLRLSLTNFVLPRAVARNIDRRAYEETRERARAIHARLLDGGTPGVDLPPSEVVEGTWKEIGLDVWDRCAGMEVGEWSEPLESVGAFVVWRLVEEQEKPRKVASTAHIERYFLPYLPEESPHALVQQAIEQSKLEFLDPEWAELLPLVYHNDMQAEVVELDEEDGDEEER